MNVGRGPPGWKRGVRAEAQNSVSERDGTGADCDRRLRLAGFIGAGLDPARFHGRAPRGKQQTADRGRE